jgi:phosphoserine phosphatase
MAIKLIFFDMEGTIFRKVLSDNSQHKSMWTGIAQALGKKALNDEEKTLEKWNAGKYAGYVEWCEDSIRVHVKHGITKGLFEKVIASYDYFPGVKEVFAELKKKGMRTALISGGFKAMADKAQRELKIDHSLCACEYLWDGKGNLAYWNILPCDYEGKVDFMKLIMKEHGFSKEECAFVGDGKNDVHLAKAVGLSIAFNAAAELQKAATFSIKQPVGKEDFREILKYL